MQKQDLSTVDTRVSAIATILSSFSYIGSRTMPQRYRDLDIRPHRNQILLGGHHLRGRLLLTPDLNRIESANSHWEVMPETYVDCRDERNCLAISEPLKSRSTIGVNEPGKLGIEGRRPLVLEYGHYGGKT